MKQIDRQLLRFNPSWLVLPFMVGLSFLDFSVSGEYNIKILATHF